MKNFYLLIIFILLLLSCHASHRINPINSDSYIIVEGQASVDIPIENIFFHIDFEGFSDQFLDSKSSKVEDILNSFKIIRSFGINDSDFTTTNFNISETWDEKEKVKGKYNFSYQLLICLRDLSKFEPLIDSLSSTNMNSFSIVGYSNSQAKKYQEYCYAKAISDATNKAEILLKKSAQKLGKIYKILATDYDPFEYYDNEKFIIQNFIEKSYYDDQTIVTASKLTEFEKGKSDIFKKKKYSFKVNITVLFNIDEF